VRQPDPVQRGQDRGIADPVRVSEAIRDVWNRTARPKGPASTLD